MFVLCLVPLVLLLFSVAGFLLKSEEIAEHLFDTALLVLPAYAKEVTEFLGLLAKERAVTGMLGAAGLVIFASQLFALTRAVLNQAFRVTRRRLIHGFAFDVFAVLVASSLVIAFAVAVLSLFALGDLALRLWPLPLPAWMGARRVLTLPLIYTTGLVFLFFVYRAFPNTTVPVRAAAGATLVVAVLWELARWLFTGYVTLFGVYGKLYGSFGVGMALLVWIYYSAVIFVFGAGLAAVITEGGVGRAAQPRSAVEPVAAAQAVATGGGPGMVVKPLLVAVFAAAVAVFALQNGAPTTVRFLVWRVDGVPLAGAVLLGVAVGILLVGPVLWLDRVRLRAQVRDLDRRLAAAETRLAAHEEKAS